MVKDHPGHGNPIHSVKKSYIRIPDPGFPQFTYHLVHGRVVSDGRIHRN